MTFLKSRGIQHLLIILFTLIFVWIAFDWITQYPFGWADDDAYFYSQISYNIATTGEPTFDGLNRTDGFHLLWTGILTMISWIVSLFTLNKEVHLYFFMAFSIYLIFFIPWRYGTNKWDRVILFGLAFMGKVMMETQLLIIVILELMRILDEKEKTGSKHFGPLLWILFGIFPLIRIDTIIIPAAMALYYLVRKNYGWFLKIGCAFLAGLAIHFAVMTQIAGELFSVSSEIKALESSFGLETLILNFTSGTGYLLRIMILAGLSLWCLILFIRSRNLFNNRLFFLFLGICGFSYIHLYFSWMRSWYYLPGHVILFYIFMQLRQIQDVKIGKLSINQLAVIFLLIVNLFYITNRLWNGYTFRTEAAHVREFMDQVRETVPPEEPIFQRDGAGYTGYFLNRHVINGDGLVNSHEYADLLLSRHVHNYLQDNHINYVITNMPYSGNMIDDYYGINITTDEFEPVIVKQDNGSYFFTHFVLFKRKPETGE